MRIDLLEAFGLEPKIITVLKQKYGETLLPIQEKAFKDHLILRGGNFLISAVTSSGKTLIGEILALHYGSRGKRALYLVPMKALAEEKFEQFFEDYRQAGIDTVISTHDRREYDEQILSGKFHIAIIVYEKLHALLVQKPELISDVGLVVVDELQYMADEDRGPALEMLLTRILLNPVHPQLVGLSAVLGKSEQLAAWLRATLLKEETRPVELRQGVFYEGAFHYREFNSGQMGEEKWFELKSKKDIDQYVEAAKYLAEQKGEQTVFFLPDKPSTESLALRLTRALQLAPAEWAIAEMKALEESVSQGMLLQTLQNGIAVHNADLSWEEKDIIERYVNKGEIRVLCSTSTLAVGLNLPMKNAVIAPKRWKNFRATGNVMLVNIKVSEFENMGGRVARYGYIRDFGRAIFVTTSFVNYNFYYKDLVCGHLEDFKPALDRKDMDKHILDLIASKICRTEEAIKTFLKNTFSAVTLWHTEMNDADYEQAIAATIKLCVQGDLLRTNGNGSLSATDKGRIAAAKGIALDTAAFFLEFLNSADPHQVSELELLLLLGLCQDARLNYLSLKSQSGFGGYRDELRGVLYECGEEHKPLFKSIWDQNGLLRLDDRERAVKKALMMQQWISKIETKDIERKYQVFSGAIKKVGEDFSWLAETLMAFAEVSGWDDNFVKRMQILSHRLVCGVTEKGLALSQIRIRGMGRAYINRLIHEGYDTPKIVMDLPLEELTRLLPQRLAERLYRHCHKFYANPEEGASDHQPEIRETAAPGWHQAPPPALETINEDTPKAKEPLQSPLPALADLLNNEKHLFAFRAKLEEVKNLHELIADPPGMLLDERQMLFFFRGIHVPLPFTTFKLLSLLANKPREIVTRKEMYQTLWPNDEISGGANGPYDHQITDHKHRIISQIKKATEGTTTVTQAEIKKLIVTKPRIGYTLNVDMRDVYVLGG
jgi:helicase